MTVEFLPLLPHRHSDSARHALHCQASIGEGLHMKKLLVASLAGLALTTGSALAADLGQPLYKAPPPPPAPVTNWTGCYIDGGVGYGFWRQDHFSETDPGGVALTPTV